MGLFGYWLSVPFGEHDDFIDYWGVTDVGTGATILARARSGYEQYFRVVVDGVPQGPPHYIDSTFLTDVSIIWASPDSLHAGSLEPQGDWDTELFPAGDQHHDFLLDRSDRIAIDATYQPEFFTFGDGGQLSGLTLSGLRRFANCAPWPYRPRWAVLDLTIDDTAGTRTVELRLGGSLIASGSRSGDGLITLSASNASGVSGSVTIAYTSDVTSGALAIARFPNQTKFHHKTSPFIGGDFPRVAEGTRYDDGYAQGSSYVSARQSAGTHYALAHQVDENGNESTGLAGGGTSVALKVPPEPPGVPVYSSGGAAATVIEFAASSTAGATYNIYDSGETGFVDVLNVSATHAAGSGTLTQTLAAISGTFTGTRYVIVRAVSAAGVEEANVNILSIEYASGVVVLPRPNAPGLGLVRTSGRQITVPISIDTRNQAVAAATLELFVYSGAAPSYGSPSATAAVPAAQGGVITFDISFTAGSDGFFRYAARTKSAAGTQSNNTDVYGPVRLTTATVFPDPASFSVRPGF